jgi:hypothetical protein
MEHRAGGDHLGVEERTAREQAMEEPAMPIGPFHHGGDAEAMVQVDRAVLLAALVGAKLRRRSLACAKWHEKAFRLQSLHVRQRGRLIHRDA